MGASPGSPRAPVVRINYDEAETTSEDARVREDLLYFFVFSFLQSLKRQDSVGWRLSSRARRKPVSLIVWSVIQQFDLLSFA